MITAPSRYLSPVGYGISPARMMLRRRSSAGSIPRRAGREVQQAVEHERGLGAARAPVGAGEGLVRHHAGRRRAVVRDAVRAGQVIDGVLRHDLAERGVGAVVAGERRLQGGDGPVGAHAEPRDVALVAIGRGGEEVLGARLHPLDRPAHAARHGGDQHLLRIGVPLAAEAAADVGREDAHVLLREPQGAGDRGAHRVGHLGRAPHREASIVGRRPRQDAARLQRHRRDPRERQPGLDDHLRLGESRLDGAHRALGGTGDVVGPLREDARRAGGERRVDVGGRGQDLVVDAHREGGVGGAIAIVGEHHRHRFARVARDLARDGGMGIRPEIGGGDEGRDGGLALRQVGAARAPRPRRAWRGRPPRRRATMRAWACGLRTIAAWSMSGRRRSSR